MAGYVSPGLATCTLSLHEATFGRAGTDARGTVVGTDGVRVMPEGEITPIVAGRSVAVTGVMEPDPVGLGTEAAGSGNVEAMAGAGGGALGDPGMVRTGIDRLTTSLEIGAGVITGLLLPMAGRVWVGNPEGGALLPKPKAGAGPGGAEGVALGGGEFEGNGNGTDGGGGTVGEGNGAGTADSGAGMNSVRRAGPWPEGNVITRASTGMAAAGALKAGAAGVLNAGAAADAGGGGVNAGMFDDPGKAGMAPGVMDRVSGTLVGGGDVTGAGFEIRLG